MISDSLIEEFAGLHEKYIQDSARMTELQRLALMEMREIGVGCANEKNKTEFANLKAEIETTLVRIKLICDTLK